MSSARETAWSIRRRLALPRGLYTIVVRGIDDHGNVERLHRRARLAQVRVR
jgi:hypothetical protein